MKLKCTISFVHLLANSININKSEDRKIQIYFVDQICWRKKHVHYKANEKLLTTEPILLTCLWCNRRLTWKSLLLFVAQFPGYLSVIAVLLNCSSNIDHFGVKYRQVCNVHRKHRFYVPLVRNGTSHCFDYDYLAFRIIFHVK